MRDLKRVIVGTTVLEKEVAYPTDSRLLEAGHRKLVLPSQKRETPCGMQGASGPLSAVVFVGLARVGDVTSKLTKGRYRSVA